MLEFQLGFRQFLETRLQAVLAINSYTGCNAEMMTRLGQAGADVKSLDLNVESVLDAEAVLKAA